MAAPNSGFTINIIGKDNASAEIKSITKALKSLSTEAAKVSAVSWGKPPTAAQVRHTNEMADAYTRLASSIEKVGIAEKSRPTTSGAKSGGGLSIGALGRGAAQFLGIGIGAFALRQAADWTIATTEIGAGALDVENSLDRLSASYNVNGRQIANDLIAMAHGSMTQMDAMSQVNRALFAQNAELARDLPQIFAIARAAAIKSGEDVQRTYDSLILGILRGSYRLIDNADIYLRVAESVERWAAGMGKAVDEMSIQERQIAVKDAILKEGIAVADAATSKNASYAESIKAITSSWTNFTREAGKALAMNFVDSGGAKGVKKEIDEATEALAKYNEEKKIALAAEAMTVKDPRSVKGMPFLDFFLIPLTEEKRKVDELNQAYVQLVRYRIMSGGGMETRRGGAARPIAAPATQDADAAKKYAEQLQFLAKYSGEAKSFTDALYYSLVNQKTALDQLYTPAMRAARGYRELARVIREAGDALDAEEMAGLASGAISSLEGILLGFVDSAGTQVVKAKHDEVVRYVDSIVRSGELNGATMFDTRVILEKYTSSVKDWGEQYEKSGEKATTSLSSVKKSLEDLYSDIESVATSGLEVTEQDVLDTAAGVYQNKALEAVRRLRDIANLGSESPFIKLFQIPPEVLAKGEADIKAWANRMADRGAALLDFNLIDKDAFLRQWDQFQADALAKQQTLAQLAQLLVSTGRVSSAGQATAGLNKIFGIDDPAGAAASISQGVVAGVQSSDITGKIIDHVIAEGKKREADYKKAGGIVGAFWATGLVEAVKTQIGDMRDVLADILVPAILARLPKEAAP